MFSSEIGISEGIALVAFIALRTLLARNALRSLITSIALRTLNSLLSLLALQISRARAGSRCNRKSRPYPFMSDRYSILAVSTCGALSTSITLFALRTLRPLIASVALGALNSLLSLRALCTGISFIAFLPL